MEQQHSRVTTWSALAWAAPMLAGVYLLGFHGNLLYQRQPTREEYLLFHTVVELFGIAVAAGVFMLAWNSRRYLAHNYLLFVATAMLLGGVIGLAHMLAFPGLNIFPDFPLGLAPQLWIGARLLEAVALVIAPLVIRRRLNGPLLVLGFAAATALLFCSIFWWRNFPLCQDPATRELTTFKIVAEYAICALLAAGGLLLWRIRQTLDRQILGLLLGFIAAAVISELMFTGYKDPYGPYNMLGHMLRVAAFFLLYLAIVHSGLRRPYDLLFRELKQSEVALRESEERYRQLVELSPECVAVHRAGKYVYLNPAGAALFGAVSAGDVLGRAVLDLVHPEDREPCLRWTEALRQGEQGGVAHESRLLRLDGQQAYAERRATSIMWLGEPATLELIRDVTLRRHEEARRQQLLEALHQVRDELESRVQQRTADLANTVATLRNEVIDRRRAEEALRESEDRFQQMSLVIPEVFWMADSRMSQVLYVSPAGARAWGRPRDQLMLGTSVWFDLVHPEDRPRVLARVAEAVANAQPGALVLNEEFRVQHADGVRRLHMRAYSLPGSADRPGGICGLVEDVTDRRRLESEILHVGEMERQRIGGDLHDTLGQSLTGVGFLCNALQQSLARKGLPEAEEANEIVNLLRESISLTRALARGLCPVEVQPDGLMAALREVAEQTARVYGLPCRFLCPRPVLVSDADAATHVYNIAKEAVNNALKHARARQITIEFDQQDGETVLTVRDDGVGIPQAGEQGQGLGLRLMRYRASMIGARVEVCRPAEGGTAIVCRLRRPDFVAQA